ncbi:hypothetical protein [Solemya velum gill symbiont]|uniref:hypothetical protein n=1 Tax=Solemya velum gill symbiont TaxID=2340 RepID=UPI001E2CE2D2|nr:hypothetical protein [Solemya velum gill symbiont]
MNRRHFLQAIAACLGLAQLDRLAASVHADPLLKVIPSSGEKLPAIGMGSFVSFNVGHDVEVLQQRTELLRIFSNSVAVLSILPRCMVLLKETWVTVWKISNT